MTKAIIALSLLALLLPMAGLAQSRLVLEAVTGPHLELTENYGLSKDLGPEPLLGQAIVLGNVLKTGGDTIAYLRIEPLGTRLILGPDSAISPRALEDRTWPQSEFNLLEGSLDLELAPGHPCQVRTPLALAIGGLDTSGPSRLSLMVRVGVDRLEVKEGLVRYTRLGPSMENQVVLLVKAGEAANALASDFRAQAVKK